MKRAILLLFMAVAICSSCKKDQKKGSVTPAKTYKVSFNVSGFTQTLTGNSANKLHTDGLKTNDAPLSSYIDNLYYFVYNTGASMHYLFQASTASNFGTIVDSLPAGSYTIVFIGGKTGLNVSDYSSLSNLYLAGYGTVNPALPWQDTFFKQISVTVSGSDISQTVAMDRIVSELTVNVKDVLPANAYSMSITAPNWLRFSANYGAAVDIPQPVNYTTTVLIPASAIGTANFKASVITLTNGYPITVSIAFYDKNGKGLASTVVKNVSMHANTQTILSGYVFGSNGQLGFGITANAAWDPSTINVTF